ncbi:MAG: hypothetical protein IT315_01075 [Anaerolineales bacterium]|nr:hypothetical protein [Anaerolineales bacterium]
MDNSLPNPDLVGDLFWGVFKPQWIRLALTSDIFESRRSIAGWVEERRQINKPTF